MYLKIRKIIKVLVLTVSLQNVSKCFGQARSGQVRVFNVHIQSNVFGGR